jgi:hypothetical protein
MANILYPTNVNMTISWIKRTAVDGNKLHFTLHNKSGGGVIGKAIITADQIKDYILIKSLPEARDIRISNLYKELEDLLYSSPKENECSSEETELYEEMANLYNVLSDYLSGKNNRR